MNTFSDVFKLAFNNRAKGSDYQNCTDSDKDEK
jgi:hypothetical protein